MKVKVTEAFIDKYTGKNHEVGEVFEADEKRIKEIQEVKASLIKVMKKADKKAPAEADPEKEAETSVEASTEADKKAPAEAEDKKTGKKGK